MVEHPKVSQLEELNAQRGDDQGNSSADDDAKRKRRGGMVDKVMGERDDGKGGEYATCGETKADPIVYRSRENELEQADKDSGD